MEKIKEYMAFSMESLNKNKYFIGFSMIMLNIGARFIIDELDDDLRKTISKNYRKIFIFCSFFMATRDLLTAFILTFVFIVIINEFLSNEKDPDEKVEKGASYNKDELDKTIQKLKSIQNTI